MKEKCKYSTLTGFMLLPVSLVFGYRGVDRHPFQPSLVEEEIDPYAKVEEGESCIWPFCRPGWRRDAYQLYEENLVKSGDEMFLLSSRKAAREIQRIIEPHIGSHEIVACKIWSLDTLVPPNDLVEATLLGYDIAYPGGDFYSAILNGLFINPHPDLVTEYKSLLNQYGLFSIMKTVLTYIHRFKELVPSESKSEFYIFRLTSA